MSTTTDTPVPITDFADLGYNAADAADVLELLGVIESAADISDDFKAQLESLALMGNLVMLDAISDKSGKIEQQLTSYQIDVDKLSGMQEALTLMHEKIDASDATLGDLFEFVTTDNTFIDQADTTLIDIDYSFQEVNLIGSGETETHSFDTLAEFIELLNDTTGSGVLSSLIYYELLVLLGQVNNGGIRDVSSLSLYDSSGNATDFVSFSESFQSGGWLFLSTTDPSYTVSLTYDDFVDYLIALRLQEGGYIGEDVFVHPVVFAQRDPDAATILSTDDTAVAGLAEFYVLFANLYWGKVTFTSDTENNLLSMDYNGTAALREMGISIAEYSQDRGNGIKDSEPYPDEESTRMWLQTFNYAEEALGIDNNFSNNEDLQEGNNDFDSTDIDIMLEAVGTAIESQSTTTEVKLLTVNSSITEWGEMNDVWDLIHEYIHDALKRASDNSL